MRRFKAAIFDIGDTMEPSTLIQKHALQKLQRNHKLPKNFTTVYLANDIDIKPHMFHAQGDVRIMRRVAAKLHLKNDIEKLTRELQRNFWTELGRWYDSPRGKQLGATFRWLRKAGYKVCILSDNSLQAKRKYIAFWRRHGIRYDIFLVSEQIGFEKPDRRTIEAVPKALKIANSETIHFGNNLFRDAVCRKWGMPFVLMTGFSVKHPEIHYGGPRIRSITPRMVEDVMVRS